MNRKSLAAASVAFLLSDLPPPPRPSAPWDDGRAPPRRVSIEPCSPFFPGAMGNYLGVTLGGKPVAGLVEACMDEGWVRVALQTPIRLSPVARVPSTKRYGVVNIVWVKP